ncbi:MAG: hypothetical protein LPK00_04695 [Bacillaceae bacterium]|nr:hypothetical protein [Bacillaceae bacterium]
MIVVQVGDSCGRSGKRETPQSRMRRGGSRPARGKRRLALQSTAFNFIFLKNNHISPLTLIHIFSDIVKFFID